MTELIIGVAIGVTTVLTVVAILLSIYAVARNHELRDEIGDFAESVEHDFEASDQVARQAFAATDGAITSLASKQGFAWDEVAGDWRRVQ